MHNRPDDSNLTKNKASPDSFISLGGKKASVAFIVKGEDNKGKLWNFPTWYVSRCLRARL